MKTTYLALMEKTLSAYTIHHISHYFEKVKKDGLTEHGFPRLTANIGILIANGRRTDLSSIFFEMMEFCCKTIPTVKADNDFSVRELISCIQELEKTQAMQASVIARWKEYLAKIEIEKCYTVFAKSPTDKPNNWALFTGVSEYFRQSAGLCDSNDFIDTQIASQLQRFDGDGLYMDKGETHNPITYDVVARGLMYLLLHAGYRGKYAQTIDEILKKSALYTLNMQSVTGEIPFGGRSNQFVFNEAWLAGIFEYEASRYKKAGNDALAQRFKGAANRALETVLFWLDKTPISHIKNRFSSDSRYGCESYAYFDKYMITTASFLYVASLFCDETIAAIDRTETAIVWRTSDAFHKTFVKAGEYSLEFDTNADLCYDANGLGRIHKKGAPSTICLSLPFAKQPNYALNGFENQWSFSICPAIKDERGEWLFASEESVSYSLTDNTLDNENCCVVFECVFTNGKKAAFKCKVNKNGVSVQAKGATGEEIGVCLPIFSFDGEAYTKITEKNGVVFIEYDGWICEYKSERINYLDAEVANRNGIYKCYMATAVTKAEVQIRIYPVQ